MAESDPSKPTDSNPARELPVEDKLEVLSADKENGEEVEGKTMGFFDHLEELRWTVVKCAITFAVFATLIGIFLVPFFQVLLWPLKRAGVALDLGVISVMEPFTVIIQIVLLGGLGLSAPFMLFFIGQFVSPALNKHELKMVLPTVGIGFVLFVLGAAFSFMLLIPSTIRVSVEFSEMLGFTERWTPGNYFSMVTWLTVGVGAAFEFPLLIVLMVYMGMVTVEKLRGWWKHALVAVFIVAAIVTPTPEPMTQTLLAVPLYGLYWLAILAASYVSKREPQD